MYTIYIFVVLKPLSFFEEITKLNHYNSPLNADMIEKQNELMLNF